MQQGEDSETPSSGTLSAGDVSSGTLYVVATPIGNLEDISRRALNVLAAVALIAAEDTRRSLSLLSALGVPRPRMLALHEHNEAVAGDAVRTALNQGQSVALISDAGTPLLSDPGFALVRSCYDAGIPVRPVPGPSAVVAALSVCPLPTTGFSFAGFLPARAGQRRARLVEFLQNGNPVVFFEAPHRLRACLSDLAELGAGRRIFVAREMTKRFETYLCAEPALLIEQMDAAGQWRGEMVCVLEGAGSDRSAESRERIRIMQILGAELAPAQAARIGALILGVKKAELYDLARQQRSDAE